MRLLVKKMIWCLINWIGIKKAGMHRVSAFLVRIKCLGHDCHMLHYNQQQALTQTKGGHADECN